MRIVVTSLVALLACGSPRQNAGGGGGGGGGGGSIDAPASATIDAADHGHDAAIHDGATVQLDSGGGTSVITGGPCMSGAAGKTAYRVHWIDAGGTAQVEYEVDGLPDHTRDRAGAYGFQIGFTPQFVDQFLAQGGLQLDGSDFIDLEITTAGVTAIASATLAIYGRSFDTTASGSFNWQTFVGTGATATDAVSNVAPYAWYAADMTTELAPNDPNTLIRIKAGLSSGSLVVDRVELCVVAS